jgi:cell division FtsZ-interacting protein ZapD
MRSWLQAQVDDRRNPRSLATLDQLLDRRLDVVELETMARVDYMSTLDRHVRRVLGWLPLAKVDAKTLESIYANLRKCCERCGGRK